MRTAMLSMISLILGLTLHDHVTKKDEIAALRSEAAFATRQADMNRAEINHLRQLLENRPQVVSQPSGLVNDLADRVDHLERAAREEQTRMKLKELMAEIEGSLDGELMVSHLHELIERGPRQPKKPVPTMIVEIDLPPQPGPTDALQPVASWVTANTHRLRHEWCNNPEFGPHGRHKGSPMWLQCGW